MSMRTGVSFNTPRVRFEPSCEAITPPVSASFQYPKGTIRTRACCTRSRRPRSFQYPKGTIRTIMVAGGIAAGITFNTPRVRFELWADRRTARSGFHFQYPKGTIRTSDALDAFGIDRAFNTPRVRFEPGTSRASGARSGTFNTPRVRFELCHDNRCV